MHKPCPKHHKGLWEDKKRKEKKKTTVPLSFRRKRNFDNGTTARSYAFGPVSDALIVFFKKN